MNFTGFLVSEFPKLPTKDNLIEGEIAVNYLKGHETLSIKNTENEIVGFVNEYTKGEFRDVIHFLACFEKKKRINWYAAVQLRGKDR